AAPQLVRLEVTPAAQVLVEPQDKRQMHAVAHFSDGTARDVTRLAVYDPAERIASVSHDGLVERQAFGETTLIVRYLDRQVAVPLAFVPARPDFSWSGPSPINFIDELVFANLQRLRMTPSELCSDSDFIRRAYLDLDNI